MRKLQANINVSANPAGPPGPGALAPQPSSTEKVAILLAALENTLAVNLLKKFEPDDVKRILESSNKLGALNAGDVEPLVEQFAAEFSEALGISAGPDHLMALLESAFSAEQVAELLGRTVTQAAPSVWSRFQADSENILVPYLLDESEAVTAFVLSRVPSELSAKCLAMLPRATRNNVVGRMLKMGEVHPAALQILEQVMEEELFSKTTQRDDGATREKLAAVVNRMDRQDTLNLLDDLQQTQPEDVKALRKLIFMFEDISLMDAKQRAKLLDRVPADQLISALFATDPAFRETIMSSLGARARRMVESELQGDVSQPKKDTLVNRRRIAELTVQLAKKGEVELPDPDAPPPADGPAPAAADAPAAPA